MVIITAKLNHLISCELMLLTLKVSKPAAPCNFLAALIPQLDFKRCKLTSYLEFKDKSVIKMVKLRNSFFVIKANHEHVSFSI